MLYWLQVFDLTFRRRYSILLCNLKVSTFGEIMNRELGILLRNSHPNDFMFCVPLNFDSPQLVVCKMEAPDSSKMLLRAAYKFGHLVKL